MARAAYRRYPWLGKDDPRPFPEQVDDGPSQLFTELARDLAHDYTVRDQVVSAIRDLRREGKSTQAEALKVTLAKIEERIKCGYGILTGPKYGDQTSRVFNFPHQPEEMGCYYFFDDRQPIPNRYNFLGFRCDECDTLVVQLKQSVYFGQGWKCLVASCFCRSRAVVCPPAGRKLEPLTGQKWNSAVVAAEEEVARNELSMSH